ncbi:DEAD/DEAH box helicase [Arenibaculum pallidiluteum]|uniref:DEAD/DEAH box helicase n=1 Tax=Arenibaculum pallidiluteum TaxID=2812559 RepID=UPI001A96CAE8|nr:DEAD/DEAH box helicase [Arenibaculum pallidiluteum]
MPSDATARTVPAAGQTVPFSQDDIARTFDQKAMQRGRALILSGAVRLVAADGRIEAVAKDYGREFAVVVSPVQTGRRLYLERRCPCGGRACAHAAAAAMLALETAPQWRRAVQTSLLDMVDRPDPIQAVPAQGGPAQAVPVQAIPVRSAPVAPAPTGRDALRAALAAAPRPVSTPGEQSAPPQVAAHWTLEPGRGDAALFVTAVLKRADGDRPATPAGVAAAVPPGPRGEADRTVARLLGQGEHIRTAVPRAKAEVVDQVLRALLSSGRLRWHAGQALSEGPRRTLRVFRDAGAGKLRPTGIPEGGALVKGIGYWVIDPAAGHICPVDLQVVAAPAPRAATPKAAPRALARPAPAPSYATPIAAAARAAEPTIIERTPRVLARMGRVVFPEEGLIDVLRLSFDYGEPGRPEEIEADDQRQFARVSDAGGDVFVRRDRVLEQAAVERLLGCGFGQLRIEAGGGLLGGRGSRVFRFPGADAAKRWDAFLATEVESLRAAGWTVELGADFGTRVVDGDESVSVAVRDAGDGWFDLDVGIDVDGRKLPLLPILMQAIARGGMAAVRVIDGRAQLLMEDGTVLSLPADRVSRLVSVVEAMVDSGKRLDDRLRVPLGEADALLDIDELVARRSGEAQQIEAYLRRIRETGAPPAVAVPASFLGELRDYQRDGLAWLQGLRANGIAGILADDMGLGKTAQTLAHIALEHEEGRLTDPCLVVVPTSLVPNWAAEAARFVPHLRLVVLHGAERRAAWDEVEGAGIVVTTYGVVARDLALMRGRSWHLLVLDEAQAIKNPEAQATRAVCSLSARHRLCLSGTPVENNLGELWSQFAFLMPGLLGDRKEFQKRFRTPIEKRGDATRAALLWRRTRPFLLRRTKDAVARELPPKTEIVRRVELEPAQRDLYETIRLSVHESVRAAIAATGLARNAITVIDALLKLRQACCDPRLVKLAAAAEVRESAKLEALVDMLQEMVAEGRRILVFSQFTSMLDLIRAELVAAGIAFVELTGKTADRAEPVARFQAGEVPVFLISLKAGGRGLNLTAADTVIHYDPWWNPAAEAQATDRAYRIGQDKPVFVYKLIAAETVEERILELQRRKGDLTAATVEGAGLAGALGDADVDYLLGQGD